MQRDEFDKKFTRMKELLAEAVLLSNECALAAYQTNMASVTTAREMRDHVEKAERSASEILYYLKKFPQTPAAA
jgi:hypothetical protein